MSTSFLTSGRYSNPVLAFTKLNDDPREVVRRAVLSGLATPPAQPLTERERVAAKRQPKARAPRAARAPRNTLTPEERRERNNKSKRESKRRARAALKAQGLTVEGTRRKGRQQHPELRGLSGKAYWRALRAKRRTAAQQ